MGLCGWIVLGGLAGWVASMIAGTNARMGVIANIGVGIVGAFVGGLIVGVLGGSGVTGFNLYSFGVALLGAVLTLLVASQAAESTSQPNAQCSLLLSRQSTLASWLRSSKKPPTPCAIESAMAC